MTPGGKAVASPTVSAGVVNLVLGANWEGLKGAQPAAIPKSSDAVNAADDPCKAP